MALGPDDLVLCSGTLPRNVAFDERLKAASDAGFAAVSLWGRDVQAAREQGFTDSDLRTMLDDHGLVVAEIDPAWWWLPGAANVDIPPETDPLDVFRFGEAEIFAIAEGLGARSVNAVDVFGGNWNIEAAAEAFAGLCSRAAEHGLLVHIEWLTWSKIPDMDTALRIVELASVPNGGINIDAWHLVRSGASPDDLGRLPTSRVLAVQLDDGPLQPEDDLVHATLHDRRLPGDGDFDLVSLLHALRAIGSTAPIGVEVFSDDLHDLGAMEAARRAATSTRSLINAVGR